MTKDDQRPALYGAFWSVLAQKRHIKPVLAGFGRFLAWFWLKPDWPDILSQFWLGFGSNSRREAGFGEVKSWLDFSKLLILTTSVLLPTKSWP